VTFIDARKGRFGVAPICYVLSEHGLKIAPSTYYDATGRPSSRRAVRDEDLRVEIARVHAENYGVYGPRKVWLALNREGIEVARCTVERLMKDLGLQGIRRGKKWKTTTADPTAARPADLVKRRFNPTRPNALWVADFSYVATWVGVVYVAFVIDAYARRILGWRAATSMRTQLVLDALDQAVWVRRPEGAILAGLVHHTDAGSPVNIRRSRSPNALRPWCFSVDRHRRRCLRQRSRGERDRALQGRADQPATTLEDPRGGRDRHPALRRLVQQPPAPRGERRHPTRRARAGPLPSTPALSLRPAPPNRVSGKVGGS
jgi:hypothetical protein